MGHSGSGRQGEPGIRETGISEQLRVGLGIALSNHVGSGGQKASITEVASVAEETSVGSNRGDGGGDSNMGDGGRVVDEGGGSGEDTAGTSNNRGLRIALSNDVGSGQAGVRQESSVTQVTSVGGHRGDSGGDSNMGDGGRVVDEGGGGGENTAGTSNNSGLGISGPLSVSVVESVVANCDGDGVGGDLLGDLGGTVNHRLDDRNVSHGTDRGTNQSGGGKASIGESTVSEKLGVGLGGGQGQGRGDEKSCCGAHDAVAACTA